MDVGIIWYSIFFFEGPLSDTFFDVVNSLQVAPKVRRVPRNFVVLEAPDALRLCFR